LVADLGDVFQTWKIGHSMIAKAKQLRMSLTPTRRRVGAWLVISASKVALMICPQCVTSKASAAACGLRLALRHAAAMTGALSMMRNAAVASLMLQFQLATLLA